MTDLNDVYTRLNGLDKISPDAMQDYLQKIWSDLDTHMKALSKRPAGSAWSTLVSAKFFPEDSKAAAVVYIGLKQNFSIGMRYLDADNYLDAAFVISRNKFINTFKHLYFPHIKDGAPKDQVRMYFMNNLFEPTKEAVRARYYVNQLKKSILRMDYFQIKNSAKFKDAVKFYAQALEAMKGAVKYQPAIVAICLAATALWGISKSKSQEA